MCLFFAVIHYKRWPTNCTLRSSVSSKSLNKREIIEESFLQVLIKEVNLVNEVKGHSDMPLSRSFHLEEKL